MESQVDLQIPAKLVPVFATEGVRYRGAHGGRGSAKTRTFALMTAVKAYQAAEANISGVILCAREYMNSLEESSMEEVKQAIRSVAWLDDYFDIGEKYIRTKNRKVSYVFCGLRHNLDSIKSKARILVAWLTRPSLFLRLRGKSFARPFVKKAQKSGLRGTRRRTAAPPTNFSERIPQKSSIIVEMNYVDNPWFPRCLRKSDRKTWQTLITQITRGYGRGLPRKLR